MNTAENFKPSFLFLTITFVKLLLPVALLILCALMGITIFDSKLAGTSKDVLWQLSQGLLGAVALLSLFLALQRISLSRFTRTLQSKNLPLPVFESIRGFTVNSLAVLILAPLGLTAILVGEYSLLSIIGIVCMFVVQLLRRFFPVEIRSMLGNFALPVVILGIMLLLLGQAAGLVTSGTISMGVLLAACMLSGGTLVMIWNLMYFCGLSARR